MPESVQFVSASPVLPDKYDIIPIHGSDMAAYKRCRRYWDWTSPARNNLRRRVEIHGVNIPLWFGTGIHYALEKMYDPLLKHDPVESFTTWYEYQWNGGMVTEDWLDLTYDINPRYGGEWIGDPGDVKTIHKTWNIRGLRELLPNVEVVQEEFEFHRELGIGMMEFYKHYAEKNDDFIVVAAESSFSIPLEFEALDRREESPNYGKMLEVHARGKRDAVVYFTETDKFALIDHKTAERVDEDYFAKLDMDEQCSTYLWATLHEQDAPWTAKTVDRVIYQALRKRYPKPPTITTKDLPSINRQQEGTTAEMFKDSILGHPMREAWFQQDEKAQNYYTFLLEQGDENFITRELVTRNKYEIASTERHIKMIAQEMVGDPMIYPNPNGTWLCLHCAFRSPCISANDGSDWQGMLSDGYEQNRDR